MARIKMRDALGREHLMDEPPQRIISLIPSITETLFAFGLERRIVGVTDYCLYPEDGVSRVERVRGPKDPDIEKIISLKPDLVIANAEENRRQDVEKLDRAGIATYVTYPRTVAQGIEMMAALAAITEAQETASEIIEPIEKEYRRALAHLERIRPVSAFCPIWKKPYLSVNSDTYVHDFLRVCGANNIFADREKRYCKVTLEEVSALKPEVILLPDEPYRFTEKDKEDFHPLRDIPAAAGGRIYLLDGKIITWYGIRIGRGLRQLREMLWGPDEDP